MPLRGSGGWIAWAVLPLIGFRFLAITTFPPETSLGVVVISAFFSAAPPSSFMLSSQERAGSIAWKLLVAVVYLIAGFYFLLNPLTGSASLTLALAFFFIGDGVMDLIAYSL